MNETLILAFLLSSLAVLDVTALLFGFDSRDGFGSRDARFSDWE
jgi:hypothetical protein